MGKAIIKFVVMEDITANINNNIDRLNSTRSRNSKAFVICLSNIVAGN
jgi:hypothetical protein